MVVAMPLLARPLRLFSAAAAAAAAVASARIRRSSASSSCLQIDSSMGKMRFRS